MTSAPFSSTGSAERRIEHATDAIRSMSQDLADEVTPVVDLDRADQRVDARGAHSVVGLRSCSA
jgi:hypothetical protein